MVERKKKKEGRKSVGFDESTRKKEDEEVSAVLAATYLHSIPSSYSYLSSPPSSISPFLHLLRWKGRKEKEGGKMWHLTKGVGTPSSSVLFLSLFLVPFSIISPHWGQWVLPTETIEFFQSSIKAKNDIKKSDRRGERGGGEGGEREERGERPCSLLPFLHFVN
jgi:hypothetical protein